MALITAEVKTENMYAVRGELAIHGAEELFSIVSYTEKIAVVAVDVSGFDEEGQRAASALFNEICASF